MPYWWFFWYFIER